MSAFNDDNFEEIDDKYNQFAGGSVKSKSNVKNNDDDDDDDSDDDGDGDNGGAGSDSDGASVNGGAGSDNDSDAGSDGDSIADENAEKIFIDDDDNLDDDAFRASKNDGETDDEKMDKDDEDDEEEDENYLQKFDEETKHKIIEDFHPELNIHNYDEVDILSRVVRNAQGVIVDPLHKTLPFLTKYEKARILGERAKQLNAGAKSFIEVDPTIIDGYLIALAELEQKKIPFIVKRPMPNGGCEYWKLKDLEFLI